MDINILLNSAKSCISNDCIHCSYRCTPSCKKALINDLESALSDNSNTDNKGDTNYVSSYSNRE